MTKFKRYIPKTVEKWAFGLIGKLPRLKGLKWARMIPALLIITLVLLSYLTGWIDYLSFEEIKKNREILREWVDQHPYLMPVSYILFYIFITSLALPVDILLAMAGGFLFPQPYSTLFAILGATIGANFLFLATRSAFGHLLKEYAGPHLRKMERGFKENAVFYLFFLRLIPIFPFWLVNIAPAFLGVSFFTFAWTTLIGTAPAAFAFTEAGSGLGTIFDSGEDLSLKTILNEEIQISLLALGFFAMIPLLIQFLRRRQKDEAREE
jgi:uncharacterized membrane protein YdjX (TVP38/TMEM64 family)